MNQNVEIFLNRDRLATYHDGENHRGCGYL